MSSSSAMQTKAPSISAYTPVASCLLQRKCASCGQHTIAGEKCEECEKRETPFIQRQAITSAKPLEGPFLSNQPLSLGHQSSLQHASGDFSQVKVRTTASLGIQRRTKISQPGDKFEREADRVADWVMRMAEPQEQEQAEEDEELIQAKRMTAPLVQGQVRGIESEEEEEETIQTKLISSQVKHFLQRQYKASESEEEEEERTVQTKEIPGQTPSMTSTVEARLNASKDSGQPLPEQTRSFMESRFGQDFSQVRVHADARAAQLNRELRAQAFTHGQDVYFGTGKYSPGSGHGKRLLAHELTHVVQQSNKLARKEILPKTPKANQSNFKTKSLEKNQLKTRPISNRNGLGSATDITPVNIHVQRDIESNVEIPEEEVRQLPKDIRWYFHPLLGIVLAINLKEAARYKYSAKQVAEIGSAVLTSTGLKFKEGKQEGLVEYIAKEIDRYGYEAILIRVPYKYFEGLFENWPDFLSENYNIDISSIDSLSLWDLIPELVVESRGKSFASGIFTAIGSSKATGIETEAKRKELEWAKSQKKQLNVLIKEARKQERRPLDLPDRLVVWYNNRNNSWYLNVWVYCDARGRKKANWPLRLQRGESIEQLFKRVRASTAKACQRSKDREQRLREREMPLWAQNLKRKLEKELQKERRQSDLNNFPDGLSLIMVESGKGETDIATETNDNSSKSDDDTTSSHHIFLRIWVERGKNEIERRYGVYPRPLTPQTSAKDIIPGVRHLSAILREFEWKNIHEKIQIFNDLFSSDKLNDLDPFSATIIPNDLRSEDITVTGAKNEFYMELRYEEIYGGGELKNFYIARKLSIQDIAYFWRIYKLPKREGSWLYSNRGYWNDIFNPSSFSKANSKENLISISSLEEIKDSRKISFESTTRLNIPKTIGEYLIVCITGHERIGESKLKRASSIASYPIKVVSGKEEGIALTSSRLREKESLETILDDIEEALSTESDNRKRKALIESKKTINKKLSILEAKESRSESYLQTSKRELDFAMEQKNKLIRLKKILSIIEEYKSQGDNENLPIPSQLLIERAPELLGIYIDYLQSDKTLEGYEKELENKIDHLKFLEKSAREITEKEKFKNERSYSPEAVMISKIDGQIYPLTLILGEAPWSPRKVNTTRETYRDEIGYNLVDISTGTDRVTYTGAGENRKAAINSAFNDLGSDARYGEGTIVVRNPYGLSESEEQNRFKEYESEKGILEKVLEVLGLVAMFATMAAIAATGVGAPAAVTGFLGAVAAISGAVSSAHNISERAARDELEWDAETALDILGIAGVVPITAGASTTAKMARLGFRSPQHMRIGRLLAVYDVTELGLTALLTPIALSEDIKRIKEMGLPAEQEKELINRAKGGMAVSAFMMLGGKVAGKATQWSKNAPADIYIPDEADLKQKAELLDLEGYGEYRTIKENGWIDDDGNWTSKALPHKLKDELDFVLKVVEKDPHHYDPSIKDIEGYDIAVKTENGQIWRRRNDRSGIWCLSGSKVCVKPGIPQSDKRAMEKAKVGEGEAQQPDVSSGRKKTTLPKTKRGKVLSQVDRGVKIGEIRHGLSIKINKEGKLIVQICTDCDELIDIIQQAIQDAIVATNRDLVNDLGRIEKEILEVQEWRAGDLITEDIAKSMLDDIGEDIKKLAAGDDHPLAPYLDPQPKGKVLTPDEARKIIDGLDDMSPIQIDDVLQRHADDPVLLGLLRRKGTLIDTHFKRTVADQLKQRLPNDTLFTSRDYSDLKRVLKLSKLPWSKSNGPDVILVNRDLGIVAVLDLTAKPDPRHLAGKRQQAEDLIAMLGDDWTLSTVQDFYHRYKYINLEDALKQVGDVLQEFGFR